MHPAPLPPAANPSGRYHHGDLPNALREVARAMVAERGVAAFTIKDAAVRAGVSAAAPYRHFGDREALLRAAAREPYARLVEAFERTSETDPAARLGSMMGTFVEWAAAEPAAHAILFGSDIDKHADPELADLGARATAAMLEAAGAVAGDDAPALMVSAYAIAQGHAALLREPQASAGLRFTPAELAAMARRAVISLAAGPPDETTPQVVRSMAAVGRPDARQHEVPDDGTVVVGPPDNGEPTG